MNASIDGFDGFGWRARRLFVLLVQSALLASFLLVSILRPYYPYHPERFIYPTCVFLMVLFIWTLWSWKMLTGDLFDPYILFMLAAFAFNAGLAFLEVFRLNRGEILEGLFTPKVILQALLLVTVGLTAFHSGALAVALRSSGDMASRRQFERDPQGGRTLRRVGVALMCVAAVPTIIVFRECLAIVTTSGYSGLFKHQAEIGMGAWYYVLSAFLLPGSFFLLAGSGDRRPGAIVSLSVIIIYCGFLFFLGERGHAIMPLLAFLWLWHRCIHRIPRTALAILAVFLTVILIPLLFVFRGVTGSERFSFSEMIDAYRMVENPITSGIEEMGGSIQTVAHTIELVPETRRHETGGSYFNALLTALPNISGGRHPAMARPLPSEWLIRTVDPYIASQGGGLGYSFIAEAYLNFGWWGAAVVLGLMGFLFGKLLHWAEGSTDPARLAMLASFISFIVFFARGEAMVIVRSLLWYSLMPYLAVRLLIYAETMRLRRFLEAPS